MLFPIAFPLQWLDDEDEDDEVEIIHGESLFDDEILEDWPQ